ncbi:hypothetical protein BDB01DRAFT_796075 [Pilobolus umbonatus]|nr:hypothetical protein BDB01DRAFT_796075 [Pilobolus umbonatus]
MKLNIYPLYCFLCIVPLYAIPTGKYDIEHIQIDDIDYEYLKNIVDKIDKMEDIE